ncbi:MAG: ATP-binding protein, partial [Desulfococcaceae bacterium]|nr:ATP-binding protein [Desulfococcaceae bacterium]
KNLISTVIDPLESMKKDHAEDSPVIENALKGANLIREIVNAMNLSFKGSIDDFYYDAKHNTGKDALCLGDIITQSLMYSIGHMFDGKYFANFLRKYFPERSIFQEAKAAWQEKSQINNIEELIPFIRQYFFDIQLNISDTADLSIGNEKGSAIKMLILFQEIIFNAVKYSAFVEKDRRFLHIDLNNDGNQIVITVENRYKKTVKTKTSGLGLVIIKNFAKLLENEPHIRKDEEIYAVTIRFADFWKEKSE